jgi:hypothetical protein
MTAATCLIYGSSATKVLPGIGGFSDPEGMEPSGGIIGGHSDPDKIDHRRRSCRFCRACLRLRGKADCLSWSVLGDGSAQSDCCEVKPFLGSHGGSFAWLFRWLGGLSKPGLWWGFGRRSAEVFGRIPFGRKVGRCCPVGTSATITHPANAYYPPCPRIRE